MVLASEIYYTESYSIIWNCRRVFGNKWSIPKLKVIHWIYTVIIRPRLCYAGIVLWSKYRQATIKLQLAKLQGLALLRITGAMKSTHTAALEGLLNTEPLHLHIKSVAGSVQAVHPVILFCSYLE